jgi:ankyrin repeat protein
MSKQQQLLVEITQQELSPLTQQQLFNAFVNCYTKRATPNTGDYYAKQALKIFNEASTRHDFDYNKHSGGCGYLNLALDFKYPPLLTQVLEVGKNIERGLKEAGITFTENQGTLLSIDSLDNSKASILAWCMKYAAKAATAANGGEQAYWGGMINYLINKDANAWLAWNCSKESLPKSLKDYIENYDLSLKSPEVVVRESEQPISLSQAKELIDGAKASVIPLCDAMKASNANIELLIPYTYIPLKFSAIPFFLACRNKQDSLAEMILDLMPNISEAVVDNKGKGYIHWAVNLTDKDIVLEMLKSFKEKNFKFNKQDSQGNSLLHMSDELNGDIIKFLASEETADFNQKNSAGFTPFFDACNKAASSFPGTAESKFMQTMAQTIIEEGLKSEKIDLTIKGIVGRNYLHFAVDLGLKKVMNQIASAKIKGTDKKLLNIDERDSTDRTPLHVAVGSNKLNMVKQLLEEHGANPYLCVNGKNVAHIPKLNNDIFMETYLKGFMATHQESVYSNNNGVATDMSAITVPLGGLSLEGSDLYH